MMFYRLVFSLTLLSIISPGLSVRADNSARNVSPSDKNTNGEVRRWEVTGPWGGDVRKLVASPDNPDLLFLGTSDGQLYRSADGAQTWQRIKPGIDRRGVSVDYLIIDPRNTNIMYAAAWAVDVANQKEAGVFKSEDGGLTWKLLDDTKGLTVMSLTMAPSDSNFLIAGATNGVYRSTDGGDDWELISPAGHKDIRNINSVAVDPVNTNVIYAGTTHLPWKTVDGGQTWKPIGYKAVGMLDDSDIMGICVAPENPNLVYVNACSGIYRSTSAGEKWFKIPGIPFSARRTYALLAHPTNPDMLFAGTSEGLWRSKDGGKRWKLLTSKTVVIRSIVIHPAKPDRVIIATDDFGVRVSNNLGDDFNDANAGFIHRHILAIQPDISERGRILASVFHDGSSGSVFVSTDGGGSWQPSSRGLGTRDVYAFHQLPGSPNVIYAATNTGVYRSDDRGASWSFVGKEEEKKKPVRRRSKRRTRASVGSAVGRYEAVPVVQRRSSKKKSQPKKAVKKKPAPEEPLGPPLVELTKQVDGITSFTDKDGRVGLLAATMDGLYRTTDETKGWEKVWIGGYEPNGRVYAVATHKDLTNKIFAGTRQGLFISDDGGATWYRVERGPNEAIVRAIAIDPRDPELILLGTNQFVYRSTNGGRSWTLRGGGLRGGDYMAVAFNPANPDEVVAAEYSRGGVYRSTDKGNTWERIDSELPSSRVWTLMFDPFEPDRVYAGSYSSGVYVLTIQRRVSTGQ
ncbi:MAG TPA: YCF48-related protein [Blastocatellia bacterium]|nr:YCF48-related protein [Blastocatellia bacterium]